jgi:hypothetical protein
MTQNRFYSSVALPTTLASSLGSSGNPSVNSITGLPSSYPYTVLIDWGLSSQEAISVTSAPTGTGPYALPCTRGIDGTTAQSHAQGAIVVHGVSAEDYNEPQVHIATGTSGSAYPNVIHGLANGSSVVGTTDTQTLSNKTVAGLTSTGDINISNSDAVNPVVSITNTHSAPAASILRIYANAVADSSFGIRVTGDTVNRFHVGSDGKIQWGAGGSSSLDTDLYRASAGQLQTDESFTAATLTASEGSTSGGILNVTNTSTPSAITTPTFQLTAHAAADATTGIKVSGDADERLSVDSNGKHLWGSGSATGDTDLYRSSAGILSTDETFTATTGLQVGSATTAFAGGTGVIGITNASVAPTTAPSGGAVAYAKSGFMKFRGTDGLDYNTGHTRTFLTSAFTTNSSSGTAAQTVTGLSLALGAFTYEIELWAPYVGAGTVGSTGTWAFTFSGTATTGTGIVGQFFTSAYTAPVYTSTITTGFTSPTLTSTDTLFHLKGIVVASAAGTLQLTIANTTAADETSVLAGSYLKAQVIA